MEENLLREQVMQEMERIFTDAPYGVEHTLRVLQNAESILAGEGAAGDQAEQTVIAAILHDIGALEAQRKYGSMDGPYQEKEGEILARQILERLGADPALIERVCYLVGHHHTPARIDGLDFQILWEADLLDNVLYGDQKPDARELDSWIEEHFQTATGQQIARSLLSEPKPNGESQ